MELKTIPAVSTRLGIGDILGRWCVRWTISRNRYRVEPGLYKVGDPSPVSPVLVTANYKLTFDQLRSELEGINAWLLVLDTGGINVWCAAGKGTFGTDELVERVQNTNLKDVVSHRKLIVPQLGATGVSAHDVRRLCGFKVVYGPVRAQDLKEFIDAGMRATDKMRRVTFSLGERIELVGAELGILLMCFFLLIPVIILLLGWDTMPEWFWAIVLKSAPVIAGVLTGTVLVPILLPWIPARAFSLKGVVVGAVVVGSTVLLLSGLYTTPGKIQVFLLGTTAASFFAMQFTGATTFTSPSGVEWEMRRALGLQIGAVVLTCGINIVQSIII